MLPFVAQFHVENSLNETLLSEFKKTKKEGGKWNGDLKHHSLFEYWKKCYPEDQVDSLIQLAGAIPPLPNPVATSLRSSKRIDAITSEQSVSHIKINS